MKVWEIEEEGWDACERRLVMKGKISRGLWNENGEREDGRKTRGMEAERRKKDWKCFVLDVQRKPGSGGEF